MESIEIPKRYFCPNPLDFLTKEDFRNPSNGFRYHLDRGAVVMEPDNKEARWVKRSKNRFLQMYSVRFLKSKFKSGEGELEPRQFLKPQSGDEEFEPRHICGNIVFDLYKIFHRMPGGNKNVIDENGFVRLIGPMSPVYGWDRILLYPRLYRANRPDDFYHPDNPVGYRNKYLKKGGRAMFSELPDTDKVGIDGEYVLDPGYQDFDEQPCNALLTEEVETSVGTMRFSYAIIEDAVDAFVTMRLVEWKGEEPAPCIYGRICASNSRLPEAQSTIFHRKRDEAVVVSPQQYIPIDRPVNIVSMGHCLQLSVRIMQKREGGLKNDDSVFVSGGIGFEAQCVTFGHGEDGIKETTIMSGVCGKLEVMVYFLPSWCKSFYNVKRDSDYD